MRLHDSGLSESDNRRLQSRLDRILPAGSPGPAGLYFAAEWPRANDGGLNLLRGWLDEHSAARLIVVDILTMLRDLRDRKDTPYEADYKAVKGLQSIAMEKGVAILIVHHTRKSGGEGSDAFEKVSGTPASPAPPTRPWFSTVTATAAPSTNAVATLKKSRRL